MSFARIILGRGKSYVILAATAATTEQESDGEHIPYDQRHWTAQICLAGHVQNRVTRVIPAEK